MEQMDALTEDQARVVHENPWFTVTQRDSADSPWFRVVGPDSAMLVPRRATRFLLVAGTRDTTGARPYLEFPCGAVEEGESPATAAIRELEEETGYTAAGSLQPMGRFMVDPGLSPRTTHLFTAPVTAISLQRLSAGESWVPVFLTRTQLTRAARDGRIVDAGTLAALALLAVPGREP